MLTKTIVERWARTSSRIRGWIAGQIELRGSAPRPEPPRLLLDRQHLADGGHVLDRHDDLELERLAHAGVDDRRPAAAPARRPERSRPPRKPATAASGRCVADRPMRCGGSLADLLEPLERERHVGAALGGGQGVDLVDDDPLDAAQRLARREVSSR